VTQGMENVDKIKRGEPVVNPTRSSPRRWRLTQPDWRAHELFDFDLPPERIALRPASPRDAARLLVVDPGRDRNAEITSSENFLICCVPAMRWWSMTPGSFRRGFRAVASGAESKPDRGDAAPPP